MNRSLKTLKTFLSRNKIMRAILYPARAVRSFLIGIPYKWQLKIISNLSDLIVDDVTVRIDEFGGIFTISPHGSFFNRLALRKSYEPELVNIVKSLIDPRKDAIDVGANIGFYSVMLGTLIDDDKKVLAVEPTSRALKRLYRNLKLNQVVEKVIVFEGGVSDTPGCLNIKTLADKEEYSTFGFTSHSAVSEETFTLEQVQVSTLDALVRKYGLVPGFIKIDVEGLEPLVVKGMKNTLQVHRPILLMEWDEQMLLKNGFKPSDVILWLNAHNYNTLDPLAPSFPPKGNLLCLPGEKNADFLSNTDGNMRWIRVFRVEKGSK